MIAFDQPETVVDGNVERVMARLFDVHIPLPTAKVPLIYLAEGLRGPLQWQHGDLGPCCCRHWKTARPWLAVETVFLFTLFCRYRSEEELSLLIRFLSQRASQMLGSICPRVGVAVRFSLSILLELSLS